MLLKVITFFLLIIQAWSAILPAKVWNVTKAINNNYLNFPLNPDQVEARGARIIGGQDANAGQFPFIAAIYRTDSTGTYFCMGTLLNNRWVLTTAFCVDGAQTFVIVLGSNKLQGNDPNRVRVSTELYVAHEDYNPITLENNIGLIEFRLPITYSQYVKPIDYLPMDNLSDHSLGLMAVGWGQTSDENPNHSENLKWTLVASISNTECRLTYGAQITDDMVCAEGNYNEGTCNGDIGGPLVQQLARGLKMITAVASFISQNGCESEQPSGFTRVFPYLDWIKNVTTAN